MSHQLDGPRAKISRAKSQLAAFQTKLHDFFVSNPFDIGLAEFDGKPGHHNIRVKSDPPILPDEWGAIVGEIAHDLRSALDGLAWQLACNPGKETSFPIFYKIRKGGKLTSNFGKDGNGAIKKINKNLWPRIKAFQPYQYGNGGARSPLWRLHELNRIDKHRLMPVLAATPNHFEISGYHGGSRILGRVHLRLNAKVADVQPLGPTGATLLDPRTGRVYTDHNVRVEVNIMPTVLFGSSCEAVKGLFVTSTLRDMADKVSQVIESFSGEFE